MKLFGFNKKVTEDKFQLPENDRLWVEENFNWLIGVLGYPHPKSEQILLAETYFPITFRAEQVEVENILRDLCYLLEIEESKIEFEIHEDLRDIYGMPLTIVGNAMETELEQIEENYKIHVANNIKKHPKRLIYNLIYECVKIKLLENKVEFDSGEDTSMFIYLAGIYFGFGVILTQNLTDSGRSNDGAWETNWRFTAQIPDETMCYGLAFFSKLTEFEPPNWKDDLPKDRKKLVEKAVDFLNENPDSTFNKGELFAKRLFGIAHIQYKGYNIEEAISTLEKSLALTTDELLKSDIYNNLGYYSLRLGEYEKSIPHFQEAIKRDPDYGYPKDNLGYVLIQLGKLEEGKTWIEKARLTGTNDSAYSYRNLALYHQAKNETELAEENFQKAFSATESSVDLLEFHFAGFLFDQGRTQDALDYLKQAVEKGEPEAIEKMKELGKT
jgi:tetratricopeptide (TPR) repeat protein